MVYEWMQQVQSLLEETEAFNTDYVSCEQVLEVSRPILDKISDEPEEGWMLHTYNILKSRLYPENFECPKGEAYEEGSRIYLEILRAFLKREKETMPFSPLLHFDFAQAEEMTHSDTIVEYERFHQCASDVFMVEFLRLSKEVMPFNALGHIAGVHYVAMHMGRQLYKLGVEVDLPLISAAAIGHDIGKFGCKESERRRVPYLHYYYTDLWFMKNKMPTIGYIAANHSTWDLELENLSVESLLLIYADFRVKSYRKENGEEVICFYTLKESFDVILNKLDNVDEAKKNRYRRVYEKLVDFEKYMTSLGAKWALEQWGDQYQKPKDTALLYGSQIVDYYKNQAIAHNIHLMHILNNEENFSNILEAARSEKDWKNTRAYLNIFREYCTFMNQKQKVLIINFLYELLMHKEEDIRIKSARLMGRMIAGFDVNYRKEIPDGRNPFEQELKGINLFKKYLHMILMPDHKIVERHKERLGDMLEPFISAILKYCHDKERINYLDEIVKMYNFRDYDESMQFAMLIAAREIPIQLCGQKDVEIIFDFVKACVKNQKLKICTAALNLVRTYIERYGQTPNLLQGYREIFESVEDCQSISICYLKHWIGTALEISTDRLVLYSEIYDREGVISSVFLENLKTATPWICKVVNIDFVLYLAMNGKNNQPVHTTTHLANLLMVNNYGGVRQKAGEVLVQFIKYISLDQCNEVAVELVKGLESGKSEFSKIIPEYLGTVILNLSPNEINEILSSLEDLMLNANIQVAEAILDTVAILIERYPEYKGRFEEEQEGYRQRLVHMIGLLLRGQSDYHEKISQEAVVALGEYIFGSRFLTLEEKAVIFKMAGKKILHNMMDTPERELGFFINAASLNHVYRFISDYLFEYEDFNIEDGGRIAFFPGSFDPFSLSHKGIVSEIRKYGFEVYLAIDEFSWSKKTQPRLIRRKIAAMSVADDLGVFMFPDDIPVNIANSKDLKRLKGLFETKEIYMVAGSDVVMNASAYSKGLKPYSIQQFNHIVFKRIEESTVSELRTSHSYQMIKGKVIELDLPVALEDISSTRIRENIDLNRDISDLIAPIAQNYIYQNNLYLREPQFKPVLKARTVSCQVVEKITKVNIHALNACILQETNDIRGIGHLMEKKDAKLVVLKDDERDGYPIAFAIFQMISTRDLLLEFDDAVMVGQIRNHTRGKLALLLGFFISDEWYMENLDTLLLTETVAACLERDASYCVYHHTIADENKHYDIREVLERQGFVQVSPEGQKDYAMAVDMHAPIVFTQNMDTVLKAPFNTNMRVLKVVYAAQRKMQKALTKFLPGNLVITMDAAVIHHRLMEKITRENHVQNVVTAQRKLGSQMCVPFGKMLRSAVVPNTVTKALHTERIYHNATESFSLEEYPNYSPLRTQIRTIKSFDRRVILVDDLLHKGYRIHAVNRLMEEEEVEVNKLIMGIVSERGLDTAAMIGRSVDYVYFVPNIHSWFVESTMYPFIGGDSVEKGSINSAGLLTSINLILPYIAPTFLMKDSKIAAYEFSMVCLTNARDILKVLEEEYQKYYEKNLTLDRLGEAVLSPTCPDKGPHMAYDVNIAPSVYIENDMQRLKGLKNMTLS